jgi:hypothetical protein
LAGYAPIACVLQKLWVKLTDPSRALAQCMAH